MSIEVEITVIERVTFKRIVEMPEAEFARYDLALSSRKNRGDAEQELRDKYDVSRPDHWFDSDLEEVDIQRGKDAA